MKQIYPVCHLPYSGFAEKRRIVVARKPKRLIDDPVQCIPGSEVQSTGNRGTVSTLQDDDFRNVYSVDYVTTRKRTLPETESLPRQRDSWFYSLWCCLFDMPPIYNSHEQIYLPNCSRYIPNSGSPVTRLDYGYPVSMVPEATWKYMSLIGH